MWLSVGLKGNSSDLVHLAVSDFSQKFKTPLQCLNFDTGNLKLDTLVLRKCWRENVSKILISILGKIKVWIKSKKILCNWSQVWMQYTGIKGKEILSALGVFQHSSSADWLSLVSWLSWVLYLAFLANWTGAGCSESNNDKWTGFPLFPWKFNPLKMVSVSNKLLHSLHGILFPVHVLLVWYHNSVALHMFIWTIHYKTKIIYNAQQSQYFLNIRAQFYKKKKKKWQLGKQKYTSWQIHESKNIAMVSYQFGPESIKCCQSPRGQSLALC